MTTIISFSGAQNSGKTTLQNALSLELLHRGHKTYTGILVPNRQDGSVARHAVDMGFQINENAPFETQLYVALCYSVFFLDTLKLIQKSNYQYWVIDRFITDHVMYGIRNKQALEHEKNMLASIGVFFAKKYPVDYLFLCDPITDISADGYRSIDINFRNEMKSIFEKATLKGIKKYNIPPIKSFSSNFHNIKYYNNIPKNDSLSLRVNKCLEILGIE